MTESRRSPARERLLAAAEVRAKGGADHIARALPEGCPVRPLGMADGETPTAVYLSASGSIAKLSGQAHGQGNLEGLFAPRNRFLWENWPRLTKDGAVNGFRAELVRADLFAAAGERGIWDELERVRGAGAWRGRDGTLVLHLGDRVLVDGQVFGWGEHDGIVYPASAALLGPHGQVQTDGQDGPAHQVLSLLASWNWKYGAIAPRLVLGWIVAAMLGGALKWRPALWPTGDRGTGKSTLIDIIKALLGPNGAVSTANTTAAGIRQALMSKALPVLLDELEAQDGGGDAVHKVIELLRQASSGSIGLRGGADHKGVTFQIRSPMMATSIMVPPLRSQDRSRIAVLELLPLGEGARPPAVSTERLHALGQQLLRRTVDAWSALPDRLALWQAELGQFAGLDARGCDQYGTLLACADLVLHDLAPDSDSLAEIVGREDAPAEERSGTLVAMLGDLRADDVQDWRRCLDHLLTYTAEVWRGGDRMTLGSLVSQAAGQKVGKDEDEAQRALNSYGLRSVLEGGAWWLAVANQHQGLQRVFDKTIWAGRSGTSGGWRQTLLRATGALVRPGALRFDGLQSRVVLVPLSVAMNADVVG